MHVCVITHFSSSLSGSSVHGIYQATILEWVALPSSRGASQPRDWTNTTSVQFSHSVVSDSVTPWTAAPQASLSITNSQSLLKLMSIELVMPSNHLILCHPLFFQYHLESPKIGYLSATFYFHLICHNAFFYISKYLLHSFLFVHLFI